MAKYFKIDGKTARAAITKGEFIDFYLVVNVVSFRKAIYVFDSNTKVLIKKFNSINKLSKEIGISRETISIYLNTYVPFKGNLFLTFVPEDFENLEKSVSDAILGLDLDRTEAKKIWQYYFNESGDVVKKTYESIGLVAKTLKVHHTFINNHIDK